ncbi:PIN domain-containing protein [bacterium]|nr:PIN domain-containing protein [bacterium]
MNKYVTDTMALILRLENRRLPKKTKQIFERAERDKIEIYVPAMVLAEIGYLSEKHRIDTNIEEVKDYCANHSAIKKKEITFKAVENAFTIDDVPELHDRIIAGTAMELNLELLTNDPKIEESSFVKTIWK